MALPPVAVDPSAVELIEALVSGPLTVSTLAGVGLPLLTGLVTGQTWPPWVKGAMLAGLAFLAAVFGEIIAVERAGGGPVDWRTILTGAVLTWVVGQAAHQGLWRHTALAQRLQAVTLAPARPASEQDSEGSGEHSVQATIARATAPVPVAAPRQRRTPTSLGAARPRYRRDDEPTTLPER